MLDYFIQNAALGITLISLSISLVISLVYKFAVDQNEARMHKTEMKTLQTKMKELNKSGKQKEAMEHQTRLSEISLKQMRSTFKPMIITMLVVIPIFILVFPKLYGVDPIYLADGKGSFMYQGRSFDVTYSIDDEGKTFEAGGYEFVYSKYNPKNSQLLIKRIVAHTPIPIPFAGKNLSWLAWYVMCSIPFSLVTRKILGVV